jgi:MFS superfamily sulfate permease-like transporter
MQFALTTLGAIVLVAGITQFVAGLMRLGQWFRAVSPAVIQGMLAGIGALIFASQFHVMVDDRPRGSGLSNLLALPEAVYKGITPLSDTSTHHYAACIGLATIVTIVVWSWMPRMLRVVPAPLVAVVVATALTVSLRLPIDRVSIPAGALGEVRWLMPGELSLLLDSHILLAGLAMALVASAETLLCATAVDQLHSGPRTKYDKELCAQGLGNICCGLLRALPMTGVVVRSTANVQAGAKTRASAILHGLWLLLFVAFLPGVLRLIPISSLAAVLVYTGYKLMNPKCVKALWAQSKSEVGIYAATMAVIVMKDLLTGVLVGVALSVVKLLYTFSHLGLELHEEPEHGRTRLDLSGAATFIRLPKLAALLESIPPSTELHVHIEQLSYIDHACLDLLMNWEKQHATTGGRLVIDWDNLTARFRTLPGKVENGQHAPSTNGAAPSNGHASTFKQRVSST